MAFSLREENKDSMAGYSDDARQQSVEHLKVAAIGQLTYIKGLYEGQMSGIPVRAAKRRSEMISSIVFLIFLIGLLAGLINIYGAIGIILGSWIAFWFIITGRDVWHTTMRFVVMTNHKIGQSYITKHNIFTYDDEMIYCKNEIIKIDERIKEMEKLTGEELIKYCQEMLNYEYREKRADIVFGAPENRMI